jgi:hypothetical protein
MTRFIRIGKTMVHIPSLANVTMETSCWGSPQLNLYYHVQAHKTISYGWAQWEACEKDLIRVKQAMVLSEKALENMPLTEEIKKDVVLIDTTELTSKNS